MTPNRQPPAAMSIDVEDWFQVENLKAVVERSSWSERELRVQRNTERMLERLDERGIKCTFFCLGWVAERVPQLVQRIADAGHELASHGSEHDLVYNLSPERFRQDVGRCKSLLEDLAGCPVRGYRAPSFSITEWAIDELQELGFAFDSSAFPTVAHDRYGKLEGLNPRTIVSELRPGLHEVSISCLWLGGRGLPWGGGGYFRLLPYLLFRRGVRHILAAGCPYVFYIHPWELDPGQPRLAGMSRGHAFRHYLNLERCEQRWTRLLDDFQWTSVGDLLDRCLAA